jgi:hypothetical protein
MAALIYPVVNYDTLVTDLARNATATIAKSTLLLPDNGSTMPLSMSWVELKRRIYAVVQSVSPIFPRLWQNLEVGDAANNIGELTEYPQALADIRNQVPPGEFSAAQTRLDASWRQTNIFELAERRVFLIIRDAMIAAGGPLFQSLALLDQPPTADGMVFQSAEGQTLRGIITAYNAAIKQPDTAVLSNHELTIDRRQRQGESFTEFIAEKETLYAEAVRNGRVYPDYQKVETIIRNMLPMYDDIVDKYDAQFSTDQERTMATLKAYLVMRADRVESTAATRAPLRAAGGRALETEAAATSTSTDLTTEDIQSFLASAMPSGRAHRDLTADQLLKHVKINDALKELGYTHTERSTNTPSTNGNQKKPKPGNGGPPSTTTRATPPQNVDLSTATYSSCFTHGFYARPGIGHTGAQCKTFTGPENKRMATASNTMGGNMKVIL